MTAGAIRAENFSFAYPGGERVLQDLSFAVEPGEFVLLCGESGSGKSTLLRLLSGSLAPHGMRSGTLSGKGAAYVAQDPDDGLIAFDVRGEVEFGPKSRGATREACALQCGESLSVLGIDKLWNKKTDALSGGQKQLVACAAALAVQPQTLLLDETTGQLDPQSARGVLHCAERLAHECGRTVICAEHRLTEVLPLCDKVLYLLPGGTLGFFGTPRDFAASGLFAAAMPACVQIFKAHGGTGPVPLTAAECIRRLKAQGVKELLPEKTEPVCRGGETNALELEDVWFRYDRRGEDVLRGVDLCVKTGEVLAVLGNNGAGKSTLVKVLCGLKTPYAGRVTAEGKSVRKWGLELYRGTLSALLQDTSLCFSGTSLIEDVAAVCRAAGADKREALAAAERALSECGLAKAATRHPSDLSGGERTRAAVCKLLLGDPRIAVLDEPTQGLDAACKAFLADKIRAMRDAGKTVVLVTHDVEFAAAVATRICFMFFGTLVPPQPAAAALESASLYTTGECIVRRGIRQ